MSGLRPCPNHECVSHKTGELPVCIGDELPDELVIVKCLACELSGPVATSAATARTRWNALPHEERWVPVSDLSELRELVSGWQSEAAFENHDGTVSARMRAYRACAAELTAVLDRLEGTAPPKPVQPDLEKLRDAAEATYRAGGGSYHEGKVDAFNEVIDRLERPHTPPRGPEEA